MIPTRSVIAVQLFMACLICYMVRVNMSINILAMVEPAKTGGVATMAECSNINGGHNSSSNETQEMLSSLPDYGTRYDWDTKLQGLILGSYFWGYTLTCAPGGYLAERFGPTKTVMISNLIAGGLTLLAPLMASLHYSALIATRFLTGLTGGVIYPALHCLVSRWAPPEEKGKFIGALLGGTFGTVVTWPLLSAIIDEWGWSWSFFINGAIVLLWCALWVLLVADSPEVHPRISEDEKNFIVKSLGSNIKQTKGIPPYKKIFLSVPFWALAILHFGTSWGNFFLMTAGPNFMSSVLGFNLGHTGFLATLPYLARLILGFVFGMIGDVIRKRQLMSTTKVRKGFILFSHMIPGALLLAINATGCNITFTIALLTMSLGSNGAATLTNLQNSQDLAPNFAGTIYGIINCVGSVTGFISPLLVGYMTSEHNGLNEWHIIFSIGAAVYILSGMVFFVFGSADLQPWNDVEDSQKSDKPGLDNAAFDSASEITVKMSDVVENTKI